MPSSVSVIRVRKNKKFFKNLFFTVNGHGSRYHYQSHSLVDRYLSPPSGNNTTTTPSFNFLATSRAPHIAAPDDWPTKSPSSLASLFAISYDSSVGADTLLSSFSG